MIIQAAAVLLLTAAITITAFQFARYKKIKKLYRSEYARRSCMKSISRLLPFMPGCKSKRYRNTEALIIDSGFGISVEEFYLIKTILFILGLVFFISIETTNALVRYDTIISDMNLGRTLLEQPATPDPYTLQLERDIFRYTDASMPKDKFPISELGNKQKSEVYIKYIEALVSGISTSLEQDAAATAERMYNKLLRIRILETDYFTYSAALLAAILLYFSPELIALLKLKLIEDKRDWEILNYIYVFSIFGRLPPFNIRNVLSNLLVISDIYRPVISEAFNNIKSGKGEAAFDSLLKKVDKEELYELLEAMRLSISTGLLGIVDNIDEMAANQLKWLDIKSIKRRKAKQVIAMVPVVLVMLMAMVYFSYSLSTLTNPMNLIK